MYIICKTTSDAEEYRYASVEVTPEMAANLLTLRYVREQAADAVKRIEHVRELDRLEIWDYGCKYREHLALDEDDYDRLDNLPWLSADEDPTDDDETFSKTSCRTLTVTDSGVFWSGSPKHSDGHFETPEVTWLQLFTIARGQNPFPAAAAEENTPSSEE